MDAIQVKNDTKPTSCRIPDVREWIPGYPLDPGTPAEPPPPNLKVVSRYE